MVCLISSICRGPLGVSHLPRLWWKAIVRSVGLQDPDSPETEDLDGWCLEVLGVGPKDAAANLQQTRPTYVAFEAWVRDRIGGDPDPARVTRWNDAVTHRTLADPASLVAAYVGAGLHPATTTLTSAVTLGALKDWRLFHRNDTLAGGSRIPSPIPPLISSLDRGPLGVMQLPRTWLKITLEALGKLHPDYPACGGGLDRNVLDALGLDRAETIACIRDQRPSYLDFEAWALSRAGGRIDHHAVDAFHSFFQNRIHPEKKRLDIYRVAGLPPDCPLTNGVLLNHLEDWAYAHRALCEKEDFGAGSPGASASGY
jgi:hypothetical protein